MPWLPAVLLMIALRPCCCGGTISLCRCDLACRAADGPQLCTDVGLGTELWPQALATALPRARMVALSEAALMAAGGADSPHAHAAACRALWLRAALLQRHLEPGLPENGRFWGLVDSLMVRLRPRQPHFCMHTACRMYVCMTLASLAW